MQEGLGLKGDGSIQERKRSKKRNKRRCREDVRTAGGGQARRDRLRQ